jgi:hypothetical protein
MESPPPHKKSAVSTPQLKPNTALRFANTHLAYKPLDLHVYFFPSCIMLFTACPSIREMGNDGNRGLGNLAPSPPHLSHRRFESTFYLTHYIDIKPCCSFLPHRMELWIPFAKNKTRGRSDFGSAEL